jgi:ppGpp synthetase/RelA/SpoT-type nucleotidyltranferase
MTCNQKLRHEAKFKLVNEVHDRGEPSEISLAVCPSWKAKTREVKGREGRERERDSTHYLRLRLKMTARTMMKMVMKTNARHTYVLCIAGIYVICMYYAGILVVNNVHSIAVMQVRRYGHDGLINDRLQL